MKKPFLKMQTPRLEAICKRYRERLLLVKEWTPKNRNLYDRFLRVLNILTDRAEQKQSGMTVAERDLNGLLEYEDRMLVRVVQPWKKLNYKPNVKENRKETSTNSVDSKKGIGKGYQTNGKKLQNKNSIRARAPKHVAH